MYRLMVKALRFFRNSGSQFKVFQNWDITMRLGLEGTKVGTGVPDFGLLLTDKLKILVDDLNQNVTYQGSLREARKSGYVICFL